MTPCRASLVGRMQITAGAARPALPIPPGAVSIVIDNPSWAVLLIRWGPTPVDVADSRDGYDVAVPGPSFSSRAIPEDATEMSIAWKAPAGWGYNVDVNATGTDVVTIQATDNNQGSFFGLYTEAAAPAVSQ
jgi:hypothetical protein